MGGSWGGHAGEVPYRIRVVLALTLVLVVGACVTPPEQDAARRSTEPQVSAPAPTTTTSATVEPTESSAAPPPSTAAAKPAWVVGANPLPLRPDGFGQVLPTPPVLVNRSLPTADRLPPPTRGYAATVSAIPDDVLARSTWRVDCPVGRDDLRYLTMSFWGYDGRAHTGEMIVNASVARNVTKVFEELFKNRFPLEEMRVTALPELDLHPTGDGNNTSAFVCRKTVRSTTWSAHAYGLAIDINPFCNPYIRGDLVLPELASSYVDRKNVRPGMIFAGDIVVRAFRSIGWTWGGTWTSPVDIQHFSSTGR
ncbi:D-alanyl-D-alanine carboxypeptidase [Actinokineospora alba]|uniref:D-alanyl-D-alanine carboxypeptidase n=1 Tax=Actinokineospora alba TaxID=504798 RepID=A0A1H0I9N4_9PSEU|nr:D-alanyl-D-alanine carboxypeptidase-like protein [Actinokineospora alba]SDI87523.1 D-alanyl-D-alanine carboxypeptidase [Actinokineospora alba]SDO28085.1 D-alanyl-D-alanine carboxypeptidase [Actinokineospora alba]